MHYYYTPVIEITLKMFHWNFAIIEPLRAVSVAGHSRLVRFQLDLGKVGKWKPFYIPAREAL